MFVSVRYGLDKTIVLNTDCTLRVFMEFLYKKCEAKTCSNIDLADEFGTVQFISRHEDKEERVSGLLKERVRYVLVELKRDDGGVDGAEEEEVVMKPLLHNWVPLTHQPYIPTTPLSPLKKMRTISTAVIIANRFRR